MNETPKTMQLFEVTVTKTLVVAAESQREAELVALSYERDESGWVESCAEVKSIDQLPADWVDSLPYNGGGDQSCRQIMESNQPEPPPYEHPDQQKFDFGGKP